MFRSRINESLKTGRLPRGTRKHRARQIEVGVRCCVSPMSAAAVVLLLVMSGQASADTFGSGDNSFHYDFVTIGNPGNAADTTGNPRRAGAVDYEYRIGIHEVSRDLVSKANAEGDLRITMNNMGSVRGGPRPDMPATGVTWNEAARFINWLNTSEGFSPAYKFDLQPGDEGYRVNGNILLWETNDSGFDAANPFRNSQAEYFLPSMDEWYKAAYYDPVANGGGGGYWNYPTGSDTPPKRVTSGNAPGTAVYGHSQSLGPADVTEAGGLSPYGVMALGGNAYEWDETEFDLVNDRSSSARGHRGGNWFLGSSHIHASNRRSQSPRAAGGFDVVGFRVASRISELSLIGDFDADRRLSVSDLDSITAAIIDGTADPGFDLNNDSMVDLADHHMWVKDLKKTWFGDANLDGEFSTEDMVAVFQAGKYELDVDAGWADGDWNADGRFGTEDMVSAFRDGGYELGARVAVSAVPEPSCLSLLTIGMIAIYRQRSRS